MLHDMLRKYEYEHKNEHKNRHKNQQRSKNLYIKCIHSHFCAFMIIIGNFVKLFFTYSLQFRKICKSEISRKFSGNSGWKSCENFVFREIR
jgi:hypothetical protein